MSTTLSTVGKKLLSDLPYPIASAWNLVVLANSPSEQVRLCWGLLEVFLRYTSAILLASYLRSEPVDLIENLIQRMEKPSLGHITAG